LATFSVGAATKDVSSATTPTNSSSLDIKAIEWKFHLKNTAQPLEIDILRASAGLRSHARLVVMLRHSGLKSNPESLIPFITSSLTAHHTVISKMADPLSITASLIGLITFAAQAGTVINDFVNAYQGAELELGDVAAELTALSGVLQKLQVKYEIADSIISTCRFSQVAEPGDG
jgi:hypothetical protein